MANIEVKSVSIDSKKRIITISGNDMDEILLNFKLDDEPKECVFQFDGSEKAGPLNYLLKVTEKDRKKHPEMSFLEILDQLPGKVVFLNNSFKIKG